MPQHDQAGSPQHTPAGVPAPMTSRWHDVMVTTRAEVMDDREGHDPALVDHFIARNREVYRNSFLSEVRRRQDPTPPDLYAAEYGDQVYWDGLRVVAILRPRPDGNMDLLAVPSGPLAS